MLESGCGARQLLEKIGLNSFDAILLMLMLLALSIQGPTLLALGGMDFTIGHALVGAVGFAAAVRVLTSGVRPAFPSWGITIMFAVFTLVTVIDTPKFGFGSMIFKYAFQYLVLIVSLNLMRLLEPRTAERTLMLASWLVLLLVLANACMNYSAFAEYYDHPWNGHPNFGTIFSGGTNLEATWPAMLGVFMVPSAAGWLYLAINIAFSFLVQSRAGMMLALFAFVYVGLIKQGVRPSWKRVAAACCAVSVVAVLSVAGPRALAISAEQEAIVSGGEVPGELAGTLEELPQQPEEGSQSSGAHEGLIGAEFIGTPGRKGIWAASVNLVAAEPVFGYGAGNGMDAVRALSGYPYREDNVHNYPLQILLDFGVVGFGVFTCCVVSYLASNLKARFRSPFAAFIALYLIGGMVQFAGGELLVGFVLAGYCAYGPHMRALVDGGKHE